jgi:uncharacterized protein (DUF1810 family)
MDDHLSVQRFVTAQDSDDAYQHARTELSSGRKTSHWMWFVFPQIAGLGRSEMARRYAISSIREASAYVSHPILGARLRECAVTLLGIEDRTANEIMGEIDALKLRSSMTLFSRAAPDEPLFRQVLDRYFSGAEDEATLSLLRLS